MNTSRSEGPKPLINRSKVPTILAFLFRLRPAGRFFFSGLFLLITVPGFATSVGAQTCSVLNVPSAEYPTIQAAVDSAASCDTLMLAPGTYTGVGNRDVSFRGKLLVLTSSHGADSTILDGELAPVGVLAGGFGIGSVISDITITNAGEGAIKTAASEMQILRVKVVDNWGGGIFTAGLNVLISDCLIDNNSPGPERDHGIGIYAGGSLRIENSTISRNGGTEVRGGGIRTSGDMTIIDSIIEYNQVDQAYCGGILIDDAASTPQVELIRCEIRGNSCSDCSAGAIAGPVTLMRDCLLADNWSSYNAGVIEGSVDSLVGCTFENNTAGGFGGSDLKGGVIHGDINYAYGNTFRGNGIPGGEAYLKGNVIYGDCSLLEGNLFYGNYCDGVEEGGLIYGAVGELRENTIILNGTRNTIEPGNNTRSYFSDVTTATQNIIINNSNIPVFDTTGVSVPTLTCNDIITPGAPLSRGPYIDGGGNISADPQFCDPGLGNFTLAESSPCLFAPCGTMGAFGIGCGPAPCSILHVPTAEYPTIQSAVDNAAVCDTIMLAPGTYTGPGNRNIDFNGKSLVLTSSHGADSTIIDCEDVYGATGIFLRNGEDTTTVISDVTITRAPNGAISCSDCGLSLRRVHITRNGEIYDDYEPEGIHANGMRLHGNVKISDSIIERNMGFYSGGGIQASGTLLIENSTIRRNSVTDYGGGIHAYGNVTIVGCTIEENRSGHSYTAWFDDKGGGVSVHGNVVIKETTIARNQSYSGGFAIYGEVDSLIGCVIEGNHRPMYDEFYGPADGIVIDADIGYAANNVFRDHSIAVEYWSYGGLVAGTCGVFEHNLFVDNWILGYDWGQGYGTEAALIYGTIDVLRHNTFILEAAGFDVERGTASLYLMSTPNIFEENIVLNLSNVPVFDTTGTSIPTLICNDIITPDAPLTLGPYIDGGGNIAMDPRFCDPGNGDFTLSSISPALHQACGVMGAFGEGCSSEVPGFTGVNDVGADQGGSIRLTWARSQWDAPEDTVTITGYAVYRLQVPGLAPPMALPVDAPERAAALPAWDYLLTVPARGQVLYQTIISTLCDSTVNDGPCWSTFFVSAMTPDPLVYYDSAPDSGYSKDNVAPAAPENVQTAYHTGSGNHITWDPVTAPDFDYYRVYRRNDTEETGTVVSTTTNTEWTDSNYDGPGVIYTVTGVDDSGNEGPHGGSQTATAVGETPTPQRVTLYQNVPNPFNPTTTIRYFLPEATAVTIQIYDATGRVVRDLVDARVPTGDHEVRWHGLNNHGQRVSSGIYFYRLITGNVAETKKMVLLK